MKRSSAKDSIPKPKMNRIFQIHVPKSLSIPLFLLIGLSSVLTLNAESQKPNYVPQPPRIVRSSILRPTRVTYGDIEKTNKTCLPKDSCAPSRNDRNGAMMNDPKRRNCFCDQQCIVYEDCCVDSPFRRDPNVTYRKSELFQCVTLRQFGSLYMKTKCPASWKDVAVRRGCEEDKMSAYDPISSLPITNMKSGYTFKNYFCALCNNQTFNDRMEVWKPRLECPSLFTKEMENITRSTLLNQLEYRPDEGRWGVTVTRGKSQVWNSCGIDPVVPPDVEYLVRFCKPAIKDCPQGYNNTDVHRKCLSYTATVYHLQEGYRNVHCAICNGIYAENLFCAPHGTSRSAFHFEFNQAAFSLLFDLNPDTGNEVGRVRRCLKTEIFDPFFQKCRSILCQPGQYYKDGQCILFTTTTTSEKPFDIISSNELGDGTTDLNASNSNRQESKFPKNKNKTNAEEEDYFEFCPKIILEPSEYDILENGSVYISMYDKALSKKDYALQSNDRLVICSPKAKYYTDKFGAFWGFFSFVGVLISAICLIMHLLASALVPDLRNLSGKNLASLSVALLVIYSIFLGMPFVQIPSSSCTVMAVILYYSFMAAFCWMLILSWDVSTTLRKATSELRVSSGSQWTRFICYSSFGWLFPAVLVTISVISEVLPGDVMPWSYSPSFGTQTCWFGQKPALLIYFVGPVGFILLLNTILFIDSARLIASTTHGTAKAKACGPSHKNFTLYLRLGLLMGISWIMGIVAGFVDWTGFWIIFIFFNTLQGLFIFCAFTLFSTKVRKVLKTKLCSRSSPSPANASWTWSGIGTSGNKNGMARHTSSSSAMTQRSDLDARDSHESYTHHSLHSHHSPHSSLHSVTGGAGPKVGINGNKTSHHLYGTPPSSESYRA